MDSSLGTAQLGPLLRPLVSYDLSIKKGCSLIRDSTVSLSFPTYLQRLNHIIFDWLGFSRIYTNFS